MHPRNQMLTACLHYWMINADSVLRALLLEARVTRWLKLISKLSSIGQPFTSLGSIGRDAGRGRGGLRRLPNRKCNETKEQFPRGLKWKILPVWKT
ncbi:hypothetical protein AVEN_155287-1 [Araneus ventricosus]|uniref:Uncharacterized protein n=1 Tax=Araneus ventricosus TaxID=182803 RepID=A0A4Y2D9N0_ARAVE|nr:hypothetical protein AVEN_155287-1 [Araneus ventricosus]